jgi:hypothetical protein
MSYEREVYICRAMRSLGRKGRFGGLDISNDVGVVKDVEVLGCGCSHAVAGLDCCA